MRHFVFKFTNTLKNKLEALNFIFALIFCFILPFNNRYITYLIIPWIIISIGIAVTKRIHYQEIFKPSLMFLVFFGISFLTIFYSQNIRYGIDALETMVSLIFMPFLIVVLKKTLTKEKTDSLINVYLYGLSLYIVVSGVILFIRWDFKSISCYLATNTLPSAASYLKLSPILLKSYISMYFVWGIVLIVNRLSNSGRTKSIVFEIIAVFMFLFYVLVLGSRAALLTLFFITAFYTWKFLKKYSYLISIPVTSVILILIMLGLFKCTRVGETIIFKENNTETDKRIYVWADAIEVIRDAPLFGHGIGDGLDRLVEKHRSNGKTEAAELRINAHNQFLETTIQSGIPGLISLFLILLIPLISSIRRKQELLFLVTVVIFINFLFESMLVRLAGVLFIGFWMNFSILNMSFDNFILDHDK